MKALALTLASLLALSTAHAAGSCQATATAAPPTVVELYTSEGCSSCPPADRWLSTLKGKPDVLALAFHVTYWDKLGWPDRYAMPEATARQYAVASQLGSAQVYTPQVVVNGRDSRSWPQLPKPVEGGTPPSVTLVRDGEMLTAQVAAAAGNSHRLAGYWAVLEDSHQSQVKAGENAGETLKHDHVVRLYKPVAAWSAAEGQRAQLKVSSGVPEHPRRVVFVVTDEATHRPVQVAQLGC